MWQGNPIKVRLLYNVYGGCAPYEASLLVHKAGDIVDAHYEGDDPQTFMGVQSLVISDMPSDCCGRHLDWDEFEVVASKHT